MKKMYLVRWWQNRFGHGSHKSLAALLPGDGSDSSICLQDELIDSSPDSSSYRSEDDSLRQEYTSTKRGSQPTSPVVTRLPNSGTAESGVVLSPENPCDGVWNLDKDQCHSQQQEQKSPLSVEEFECDVSVKTDNQSEKQEFVFTLYDLEGHGNITRDDIAGLVRSIYDAVGTTLKLSPSGSKTIKVRLTVSPDKKDDKDENNPEKPGEKPSETDTTVLDSGSILFRTPKHSAWSKEHADPSEFTPANQSSHEKCLKNHHRHRHHYKAHHHRKVNGEKTDERTPPNLSITQDGVRWHVRFNKLDSDLVNENNINNNNELGNGGKCKKMSRFTLDGGYVNCQMISGVDEGDLGGQVWCNEQIPGSVPHGQDDPSRVPKADVYSPVRDKTCKNNIPLGGAPVWPQNNRKHEYCLPSDPCNDYVIPYSHVARALLSPQRNSHHDHYQCSPSRKHRCPCQSRRCHQHYRSEYHCDYSNYLDLAGIEKYTAKVSAHNAYVPRSSPKKECQQWGPLESCCPDVKVEDCQGHSRNRQRCPRQYYRSWRHHRSRSDDLTPDELAALNLFRYRLLEKDADSIKYEDDDASQEGDDERVTSDDEDDEDYYDLDGEGGKANNKATSDSEESNKVNGNVATPRLNNRKVNNISSTPKSVKRTRHSKTTIQCVENILTSPNNWVPPGFLPTHFRSKSYDTYCEVSASPRTTKKTTKGGLASVMHFASPGLEYTNKHGRLKRRYYYYPGVEFELADLEHDMSQSFHHYFRPHLFSPSAMSSPHHHKHKHREQEHLRAMQQVASWIEKEREHLGKGTFYPEGPECNRQFLLNLKKQTPKNKVNKHSSPGYYHQPTQESEAKNETGEGTQHVKKHEHHHIHEHIHHHYHHYQEL